MNIPLFDLKQSYYENKNKIDKVILKILKNANYILGENVNEFEKEFGRFLKVNYSIGVASGTDALILSLRALDIKNDDEVILPVNCYPTAFAVASVARPKFIDVDPLTLNLDLNKIEKAITKKTKAIVPVHLFGLMVDMNKLLSLAKKHNLLVIEDACQAHGAVLNGKMAGAYGDVGCFSFYPTKNLAAFGDGGMVVTNNKYIADIVRQLRMYGEKKRYESVRLGVVSRLDEIQAGILRYKLKFLNSENKKRIKNAQTYFSLLNNTRLTLPPPKFDGSHVFHLFTIQSNKRNEIKRGLLKEGVGSVIHTPTPMHLVKSFSFLNYKGGDFPVSERAAQETLSLPCHPYLTYQQIEHVCNLINHIL